MTKFVSEVAQFEGSVSTHEVSFVRTEAGLEVIVDAGENAAKSDAAYGIEFCYRNAQQGGAWTTMRNVYCNVGGLPAEVSPQTGQAVPDVSLYNRGGNDPRLLNKHDSAIDHPHIAVEIEHRDRMWVAVNKARNIYFNAEFVGPKQTMVQEVWLLILPNLAAPLQPLQGARNPTGSQLSTALQSVNFVWPDGNLPDEPPLLVILSRNGNANPPQRFQLEWNRRIVLPAWSLLHGWDVDTNDLLDHLLF